MDSDVGIYDMKQIRIEHLNAFYRYHVPFVLSVSGIHRAILEGDFGRVKRWIGSGGDVNERQLSRGFFPLHLAVIKDDMELLEYLLTKDDVTVDCTCFTGKTPFYLATALGHIALAKKLIQAGCNINIPDNEMCLPLHVSVYHPDICHLLIRRGAPIDAVNDKSRTPLYYATKASCLETLYMLLYYNVDTSITDTRSLTPFMMALAYGKGGAQWALLEYVDDFNRISYDHVWYSSILSLALRSKSPFVKHIIERGANVNYGDDPRVRDDCSAFSACLHCPVDLPTFEMVWERLEYNDAKNTIDLLGLLEHPKAAKKFLPVIIESGNIEIAVRFLSKGENYVLFVNKFAEGKFLLKQLTLLTCRLLEYGFRTSSYDVHAVFSHYGYCELFRILLYMDNDLSRGWLPHMALPRLIFDVNYDLQSIVTQVKEIPKDTVVQLLEYSVYPSLIDGLTFKYNDDQNMSCILRTLPRVPSLIELARNATRKQVWRSFKITNACQFYTTIDHLDMPVIYKNILTFKKKIYCVL